MVIKDWEFLRGFVENVHGGQPVHYYYHYCYNNYY